MTLAVEHVRWSVAGAAIVRDVSLECAPGSVVGLIGPNGSGKSSLLRCIYRVLRPDAGSVHVDGEDVWKLSARASAQRIGVVLQEAGGEFDFSVYEMVLMGRGPHKKLFELDNAADRAIVDDALQQVGLSAFAERSFQTLSGGEKQRVLMARALAQRPRFLVLDEPTNHLDIRHQLELLALLRALGVTTIAALHDLNLAAHFCDRLYLLNAGEVVASGTPESVLTAARIDEVYGVQADVRVHPVSGRVAITYLG